jgi:hypothetical protein
MSENKESDNLEDIYNFYKYFCTYNDNCELMLIMNLFRNNNLNEKELQKLFVRFLSLIEVFSDRTECFIKYERNKINADVMVYFFIRINLMFSVLRNLVKNSFLDQSTAENFYNSLESELMTMIKIYINWKIKESQKESS